MAVFTMSDPEPYILGNEPIFRDGEIVGRITSGYFGHTIGRSIGLGYIEAKNITVDYIKSGKYELELSMKRYPASVSLKPPYDPKSEKVKS
jgi:4-methylaminobutanoate oxidase (formaldehyde-forming)